MRSTCNKVGLSVTGRRLDVFRVAILAAFVLPAVLLNPAAGGSNRSSSWLAAVDQAAPVLALLDSAPAKAEPTPFPVDVLRQSAATMISTQQVPVPVPGKGLAGTASGLRSHHPKAAQCPG